MAGRNSDLRISLSYDDLVKLLGGSDEVSIEIRQGIAQSFSDKYIKGLASDQINQLVENAVKAEFGSTDFVSYRVKEVVLKPRLKAMVEKLISEILPGLLDPTDFKTRIDLEIKGLDVNFKAHVAQSQAKLDVAFAAVDGKIERLVEAKLKDKVDSVVERRVEERLQKIKDSLK